MRSLLAFLAVFLSGCGNQLPPFSAPQATEVKAIFAQLYDETGEDEGVGRFEIPTSSHEGILRILTGAKKDRFPSKWQVLGEIEISHSGGLTEIELFQTYEASGAFRADGTYYRGGSDSKFIGLIKEARKQRSEQGDAGKPVPAAS